VIRIALIGVSVALLVAGCGGEEGAQAPTTTAPAPAAADSSASPNPFPDDPQILARATTAKQRRALVTLAADIRRMRAASGKAHASLHGTPAVRTTTGRFIDDLQTSTIDNLSKNRLIDHAAAAVAVTCEQCFQQLEAMRPIPAIAH
jgi:hypothetical protein